MKNSEQPINPLPSDVDSSKIECIGLTKREFFAGLAMQGMISSNQNLNLSIEEAQCIASQSVQFADELLKQLDNEPTTNISDI